MYRFFECTEEKRQGRSVD